MIAICCQLGSKSQEILNISSNLKLLLPYVKKNRPISAAP